MLSKIHVLFNIKFIISPYSADIQMPDALSSGLFFCNNNILQLKLSVNSFIANSFNIQKKHLSFLLLFFIIYTQIATKFYKGQGVLC